MWDLERENCIAQLTLPGGGGEGGDAPAVEHLAASAASPLLHVADAGGTVRIFDLRSSELVGSVQHLRSRLAGGRKGGRPGGHVGGGAGVLKKAESGGAGDARQGEGAPFLGGGGQAGQAGAEGCVCMGGG
jgi:hypothetical protein